MKLIENTIRAAAKRFEESLKRHYPAVGGNGFNERNMTFQFAHEFCQRENTHAFFEVPFKTQERNRNDNHFDAMLFDNTLLLVVESKRLLSKAKNESIKADIKRLRNSPYIRSLRDRFEKPMGAPRRECGLVIAEHWEERSSNGKMIRWWCKGSAEWPWSRVGYPKDWRYRSIHVTDFSPEGNKDAPATLYWLYCYGLLVPDR